MTYLDEMTSIYNKIARFCLTHDLLCDYKIYTGPQEFVINITNRGGRRKKITITPFTIEGMDKHDLEVFINRAFLAIKAFFGINDDMDAIDRAAVRSGLTGDMKNGYVYQPKFTGYADAMKYVQEMRRIQGMRYNSYYRPHIEKVIFNDPATIVIWKDGSKTVVKAQDEAFDPEKGLAMAIVKKFFGNEGNYYNEFKKWLPEKVEVANTETEATVYSLSVKEAATLYRVSESTIRNHIKNGSLPYFKDEKGHYRVING